MHNFYLIPIGVMFIIQLVMFLFYIKKVFRTIEKRFDNLENNIKKS